MEKKCFKCGNIKLLSEFYKHPGMKDGHLNKCKECATKDQQKIYRKNINHYKEYDFKRNSLPRRRDERKQHSRWLRRNKPEKVKEYNYRYNKKQKKASETLNNYLRFHKDLKQSCIIRWICEGGSSS
jgi:hypothetical protein